MSWSFLPIPPIPREIEGPEAQERPITPKIKTSILVCVLILLATFNFLAVCTKTISTSDDDNNNNNIIYINAKRDIARNLPDLLIGNNGSNLRHDNNDEDDETLPIIIGAGLGTTGTHLYYDTTCHMGLTSVHYGEKCLSKDVNLSDSTTREIFKDHNALTDAMRQMSICVCENKKNRCGNVLEWKAQVLALIDRIVQDEKIHGFHDSPYPFFISPLLQAMLRHKKDPIILLGEREPEQYARKRSSKPYGECDNLCIDPPPINVSDPSLIGGEMDIVGCINYAEAKMKSSDLKTLDFTDLFVSYKTLLADNYKKGMQTITKAVKAHQDKLRDHADVSYNMFKQKRRTEAENFAAILKGSIPALRNFKELPPATKPVWFR